MSETQPGGIYAALLAAWGEVGRVAKSERVDTSSGGYRYASETDTIEALRPTMIAHGIVSHPTQIEVLEFGDYETKGGTRMNHCRVQVTYRFAHVDGSFIDVPMIGEGADAGDKAQNKAVTGAQKYALWQTFLIARGDDPDAHASEGQEKAAIPAEVTCPEHKQARIKQRVAGGGPYYGREVYSCATNMGTREQPNWCRYEVLVEHEPPASTAESAAPPATGRPIPPTPRKSYPWEIELQWWKEQEKVAAEQIALVITGDKRKATLGQIDEWLTATKLEGDYATYHEPIQALIAAAKEVTT